MIGYLVPRTRTTVAGEIVVSTEATGRVIFRCADQSFTLYSQILLTITDCSVPQAR